MPYIVKKRRDALNGTVPESPGEVNYLITQLLVTYLEYAGLSYSTINTLVGALECAKLELYRRIAVDYEDLKIKENGDVYNEKVSNQK